MKVQLLHADLKNCWTAGEDEAATRQHLKSIAGSLRVIALGGNPGRKLVEGFTKPSSLCSLQS
jgi:hypothetical protein